VRGGGVGGAVVSPRHHPRALPAVGLYKLISVYLSLESAWFEPLSLKCEKLVSDFAFKFNLYRYTAVSRLLRRVRARVQTHGGAVEVECS
jgi:hypothetical protein